MTNNQFNPNRDPQKKKENYTLAIAAVVIVLLLVGSFIYFYSSNPAPERVMVAPTPATPETAPSQAPPSDTRVPSGSEPANQAPAVTEVEPSQPDSDRAVNY